MKAYPLIEIVFDGMNHVCDAQDLIAKGASKELIMDRLDEALAALECYTAEMESQGME